MADDTTSVAYGLANTLLTGYGLDEDDFVNAATAFAADFSSTYFLDAGSIVAYGLPALQSFYGTFGLSGVEAAQTTLLLMTIAKLPAAAGYTYPDRGRYLMDIAGACSIVLSGAASPACQAAGIDLNTVTDTVLVDKFAQLLFQLWQARNLNPGSFAPFAVSRSIMHAIDNFLAFDTARLALQATVPCLVKATPQAPVTIKGSSSLIKLTQTAFGYVTDTVSNTGGSNDNSNSATGGGG